MVAAIVVIAIVVVLLLTLVLVYNRLVRLRNRTENAWAQVDVQLRRRYDLVPNLVETVKGYAAHEKGVLESVTAARTAAQGARGVEAKAEAENVLSSALGRLLAVAEAYPDLKASASFQELQAQLGEIEGDVAVSRQVYNDTVLTYRNSIQSVPTNLVASAFHFAPKQYFEIDDLAAREPVPVRF
jgi:LemA protein